MTETSIDRVPTVSIVIPAYRVASLIPAALSSAFAQTFSDFEVIVVNDGCPETADLENAIAQFKDRILYVVQSNSGPSAARNTGVRLARGEFVAFLDADDVLLPHFLDEHLTRARQDPASDVFYGNLLIFGDVPEAGKTTMDLVRPSGAATFTNIVLQRVQPTMCSLVRRSAFQRLGLFDESLRSSEDFDLWLRFAKGGARFNSTSRIVAHHRRRAGSLSADPVWMYQNMLAVLEKCRKTLPLNAEEVAVVVDQERRVAALRRFQEGKRAFFERDYALAEVALSDAHAILGGTKLRLATLGLRVAPRLLFWLHMFRNRLRDRGRAVRY